MRSTSEFSDFAARLREFIRVSEGEAKPDEAEFHRLALELFGLQFEHNKPYRRFCEARAALPETVRHWSQIPAIPTSAFKEWELSCLPVEHRTRVFHSSGTTGQQPSRHFHNAESLAIYEASLLAWFAARVMPDFPLRALLATSGPPVWGQVAILTPPLAQALHSSLVHMFETVRGELGLAESAFVGTAGKDGAWTLNLEATIDALQKAIELEQPLLLLGTAFSFVHLLDYLAAQQRRFELPAGSRALETGGYKGRSRGLPKGELHSLITQRLGIPASHIICEYGMSELCSQAYDGEIQGPGNAGQGAGIFHFPPWARVEVVSPETGLAVPEGETGLIRVFDLANVYSVMAIQTEDLGVRRGAGFELIGRAALAEPRGCSLMAT